MSQTTFVSGGDPVFVGGEHRSGTTLLAAVLDSHPRVVFGLELDFLEPADLGPHVLECLRLLRVGRTATLARGTPMAEFHWGVQFVRQCDAFGVGMDDLEPLVRGVMRDRRSDLTGFADRCALVDAVGEWRRRQTGAQRWGLKIQRHIMKARALSKVWPRARFVHIVRDGRDVAASHVREHSAWGYRDAAAAAAGWSAVVAATRPLRAWDHFHEMRYEDLVGEPRAVLGEMMDFLGLPWDDALLSHDRAPHAFLKASGYEHPTAAAIREPIHGRPVSRYRKDLSPDEVSTLERVAGPWLSALGYASGA